MGSVETAGADLDADGREPHSAVLRRVEAAARRADVLLNAVFDDMAEGVIIVDAEGVVQTWNRAVTSMLGAQPAERIGQSLPTFTIRLEDGVTSMDAGMSPLGRALRGERVEGFVLFVKSPRRPDGGWFSASASPLREESGAIHGAVAVFRDVTEERLSKIAAERAREDLRRVIESSPDGIAVSRDGRWIFANRVMARMLGHTDPDALIGLRPEELVHPEDSAAASGLADGSPEPTQPLELRFRRADGDHAILEISRASLDEFEGAKAVLFVARDVTERKRLHVQLLVSERMASVGTLAAGIAHEFNNPLASMLANLNMALHHLEAIGAGLGPAEKEVLTEAVACVRDACEAGDRLRSIARDIRLFSRVEDRPRGPIDVVRVLDSSARIVQNEVRHRARLVKAYGELPRVDAAEARLGQVFLNLLVNAAQSIPEGNAKANEIRISAFDDGAGWVVVEISDTGCGISKHVIGRVFEPFFTTKPPGVGTGLGLSICQRIVSDLGGRIEAESLLGAGTLLRVVLPVSKSAVPGLSPEPPPSAPIRRGKVLVIDDDPAMGHAVRRVIGWGHEVLVSTDAEEALARLGQGPRFDVVLCDMMMPDFDGPAFFRALSEMDPSLAARVIFLTGGAFTERARAFLESVANERVDKPFDPAALRGAVERHLR